RELGVARTRTHARTRTRRRLAPRDPFSDCPFEIRLHLLGRLTNRSADTEERLRRWAHVVCVVGASVPAPPDRIERPHPRRVRGIDGRQRRRRYVRLASM